VEASRRIRVDNNLKRRRSVATDDKETLPTNPAGGKELLSRPLVKQNEILSQSRIQKPSVRQATPVIGNELAKMQRPAPVTRGKGP